jgi:short-subunit dehydrogenase
VASLAGTKKKKNSAFASGFAMPPPLMPIVNVSSILGFLPVPFMGVYASTKHAIEGLSESLDHEVRAFGIHVVLIEPPYTRTSLDANAANPYDALASPVRSARSA